MKKFEISYSKITITVPAELVAELDRIAKLESRSRSGQATFFLTDEISHNISRSHTPSD